MGGRVHYSGSGGVPVSFGGDLTGSATSQTVVTITGSANLANVPAATNIAFTPTTPATTGRLRFGALAENLIGFRKGDDSGNVVTLAKSTANNLYLGSDSSFGNLAVGVNVMASNNVSLGINGIASASFYSSHCDLNLTTNLYGATNTWDPTPFNFTNTYQRTTIPTTDATVTTLASHSPAASSTVKYTASIQSYQTAGAAGTAGDGGTTVLTATYRRVGSGAPALVGAQTESDRQMAVFNPTVAFDVSSNTVRLRFTGEASKTVSTAATLVAERVGV